MLFEYIASNIEREGIFRINGNRQNVLEMSTLLRFPQCSVPPCADVFDAISLLKKWLIELPKPLLPPDLLNSYYDTNNPSTFDRVLSKLPEVNRKAFLLRVHTRGSCKLQNLEPYF